MAGHEMTLKGLASVAHVCYDVRHR